MKLLDRDNLVAVLWAVIYCFSLVAMAGAFDSIGIEPTVTIPVGVVCLPLLIGAAGFVLAQSFRQGRS